MARFVKFGSGKMFSRACPFGSMRLAGTRLPGNGCKVLGSFTTINAPLWLTDWEKSPVLSSAVGTVTFCKALVFLIGQNSSVQKKKSLLRFLLKCPGM